MAAPARAGDVVARSPLPARDVMAFGQEVGRVLSDGRIVGRAEPFAKVFPSSRAVKRAVGLVAWGVLEDIALDARIDDRGRLVAETNARRIAANLGLNKDTVAKYLGRLRDFGLVLQEEGRADASGQYRVSRYVLDPSSCLERFTVTPVAEGHGTPGQPPCPKSSDTVTEPVSDETGHGDTGHGDTGHGDTGHGGVGHHQEHVVQEEQHVAGVPLDDPAALVDALRRHGVTRRVATDLVHRCPPERVREALRAVDGRRLDNPAGWLVRAISHGWEVAEPEQRSPVPEPPRPEAHERQTSERWAAAVSAALDDAQLRAAMLRASGPMPGLDRWSVPKVRGDLVNWCRALVAAEPSGRLADVLAADLRGGSAVPVPSAAEDAAVGPPPVVGVARDLAARIREQLPAVVAAPPPRPPLRPREGRVVSATLTDEVLSHLEQQALASDVALDELDGHVAAEPRRPRRGALRLPARLLRRPTLRAAGRGAAVMTAAHETPEFRNAVEYTVTLTYVVAGGARHGTADRRARVIAVRLADTAARIPSVVEVHATAGPSTDGETMRAEVVRFPAANVGIADATDRLHLYLDPDHERALQSLREANAAYKAQRRADAARRAAVACRNLSSWDAGRYCVRVYCRPELHDPRRCPCGNLDRADRCSEHATVDVVVLAYDPAALRDAARRYARG